MTGQAAQSRGFGRVSGVGVAVVVGVGVSEGVKVGVGVMVAMGDSRDGGRVEEGEIDGSGSRVSTGAVEEQPARATTKIRETIHKIPFRDI